jgi:type IV pilus assembly protein PilQ
MVYQSRITTATRRTTLVLVFLSLCGVNTFAAADNSKPATAGTAATVVTRLEEPAAQQGASSSPTPTPGAAMSQASDKQSTSQQGRQYGQPGFVGEPINLNVVNADIRDILNYITEQYGVNFVIDSSVGAVPVTVNVQDVPWNVALDAVLKANRLGVEVNGNILRVAANDVLAKESETQKIINDSRLDASPLVTEFIRLNYARASGTLAQAAGSTGAFSGGATNLSFSGGAGGDATGGSADQGLMPIISRRLSRRGSIEVDGRSNTLIITDVKENIEAIRQLTAILDQPEPQVEIETRIVIAQHNFSRDLGAQLSAGVINLGRGALGNLGTLPSAGSSGSGGSGGSGSGSGSGGSGSGGGNTSGPNPYGVFGGLAGTNQPLGSLGAAAASTVIGLTTGLFGTAQISALITMAETRGEAKTVATPRVTALNNRPAQIESGSQIPVQTTQAASGTAVVTTTFVSVPLRLSITPQITDAGTVILRVTIENNTINTGIAVGGVPGIDTQRMQTEVLVPDGGTTVMGGVLADTEGETKNRTPGLASIPVLGNLFKRKLITRQNSEILFFITPHIYRPDYQGRPISAPAFTGPKTTQISQPVPMGNPQSNTPTPTQLQMERTQPQIVPGTQPQLLPAPSPNNPGGTANPARPGTLGGQRP